MKVAALLFNGFETLDVFGPVEIMGRLTDQYQVTFYSLDGGVIQNEHGIKILTEKAASVMGESILLIPGGPGTRTEVVNDRMIDKTREMAQSSRYVLTVCTGSALLAKTGLLRGREATTNKKAFDWVVSLETSVNWNKKARWCVDDKYYTSGGVSAGMDMTLGFLSDVHGLDFARKVAFAIEYDWTEDRADHLFYKQ